MKKILNNIMNLERFKFIFLITSFLYTFPMTSFFMAPLMKIFIIWGIIIFLFNIKDIDFNDIGNKLLMGIIFIAAISTIYNYKNNLISNIIMLLYVFVEIFLLYNSAMKLSKSILMEYIKKFSLFIMLTTCIGSIVSLFMAIINFEYIAYIWNTVLRIQGVYEGRLWGIYGNPNTLANIAIISIFLTLVHMNFVKNKKIHFINLFLQTICVFLTNSRSSIIALIFSVTIYFLIIIYRKNMFPKINIKNRLIKYGGIISIFFIIAIMVVGISLKASFILKREYNTGDVSNGRVAIWIAGIKSTSDKLILGVGPNNVKDAVNQHLNQDFVAANPDIASNMHNIFIQLFVSYGLIVLILFIYFIIYKQKVIFSYLLKDDDYKYNKQTYNIILSLNSLIVSLLIMNFFDSNIIFFFSLINVSVFWISLGFINEILKKKSDKKSILILIDNLASGGAENVLVNVIKNIDKKKYEITVQTLFDEGIYKNDLKGVYYQTNIKHPNIWMKRIVYRFMMYFPAKLLHIFLVHKHYDCEIAFLETGVTKIISGCKKNTKSIAWVHADIYAVKDNQKWYLNHKNFVAAYRKFNEIICVSNTSKEAFIKETGIKQNVDVIYNPIDEKKIIELSKEKIEYEKDKKEFLIVAVGRLEELKGFDILINSIKRLRNQGFLVKLWIIGEGSQRKKLEQLIEKYNLKKEVILLGFEKNPYKYIKNADLFVSSSISEGFSLVIAEAMILDIPVISTNTSGAKELLLGGKYGKIVEGNEEEIFNGMKEIILDNNLILELKQSAIERKKIFRLEDSIKSIENLLERILNE